MLLLSNEIGLKSLTVLGAPFFWNQGDKGTVHAFQIQITVEKISAQSIKILLNQGPTFFHEHTIEPICPGALSNSRELITLSISATEKGAIRLLKSKFQ